MPASTEGANQFARRVLARASDLANEMGSRAIDGRHVLLAACQEDDEFHQRVVVAAAGISTDCIEEKLRRDRPDQGTASPGQPFDDDLASALSLMSQQARVTGASFGVAGLLHELLEPESVFAADILECGGDVAKLLRELRTYISPALRSQIVVTNDSTPSARFLRE